MALLIPTTPASAAGNARNYAGVAGPDYWIGSYQLDDGTVVWCAFDPKLPAPATGAFSYGEWTARTSFVSTTGTVLDGEHLAKLAYVLGVYGESTDPLTVSALYRILHEHSTSGFASPSGDLLTKHASQLADQIWNEAAQRRGPYVLARPELTTRDGGQRHEVRLQSPVNDLGTVAAGTTTATISGPAVWESTGSQILRFSGDQTQSLRATGSGEITVSLEHSVPSAHLLVAEPLTTGVQRIVTAGDRSTLRQATSTQVRHTFTPSAESTAETWRQFAPGSAAAAVLTDVVHAASSPDAAWLTPVDATTPVPAVYRVDWYYSERQQEPSPSVPDDVELFDSTLVTATGPGDYVATSSRVADQPGWYYPVVSFRLDDQPEDLRRWFAAEFTAGFHDEREQTVVPWQPNVITQTTEIVDGQLADVVAVTGNDPEQTLEISSTLWMTNERAVAGGVESAPDDAVLVGTVTTSITGDGTVVTPGIDVPWSSFIGRDQWPTFYWSERIESTFSTVAWNGRHLLPDETITLERPSATTRTAAHVKTGDATTDEAEVIGTIPTSNATEQVTLRLNFSLYRYGDALDSAPVCDSAIWQQPDDQVVDATGRYTSAAVTVNEAGAYGFRHRLIAEVTTPTGTTATVIDEGACGADSESFVASPALAETAGMPTSIPLLLTMATMLSLAGIGSLTWQTARR